MEDEESKVQNPQRGAQELFGRFQTLQQQLQSVLVQKESLKLQSMDIDGALKELGKLSKSGSAKEKSAYKITGPIMISKPANELTKELKDSKEAIDVRIKSLEKIETNLNSQLKELQEQLKKFVK